MKFKEDYDWINKRIEELEEKAGACRLPIWDMDGSKFTPEFDTHIDEYAFWLKQDDAYDFSVSRRMGKLMGIC